MNILLKAIGFFKPSNWLPAYPPPDLVDPPDLVEEKKAWLKHTPLHVREGTFTPWEQWFAWRPVKTEQGIWVWLKYTYRRLFYPAGWFCIIDPITQYSDLKLGYWEFYSTEEENYIS